MPDFQGAMRIKLQPSTGEYPIRLSFPVAPTANGKGAIPYGSTITSAVVKAYDPTGLDVTANMVSNTAVSGGTIVNTYLSYFTGARQGLYKLTAFLTMTGGHTDEFDLRRVWVTNT